MTPFVICYVAAIAKGVATYRVAWVRDGRTPEPIGPTFSTPREAARYADRLERRAREAA